MKKAFIIATAFIFGATTLVYCGEAIIGQKQYRFKYEVVETREAPTYVVTKEKYRNPLKVGFKVNPDGTISARTEDSQPAVAQAKEAPRELKRGPAPQPVATEYKINRDGSSKPIPAPVAVKTAPEPKSVPSPISDNIQLVTVNFDLNSTRIRPVYKKILNRVATIYSEREFEVIGYTCPLGTKERNDQVATARAKAVADILTANGGTVTKAFGKPMCCYISETDLRKNRRVEVYLKQKSERRP
jgi:outer membrane protein OmpA-like peptidoglycan-associated protein